MMKHHHHQQQQQSTLKPAAATAADPVGLDLQEAAVVVVGEGDGDGGKSPPHYVQELYRRYRERVAGDRGSPRRQDEEGQDEEGRAGEGRGEGGWEGVPSRGGGGGGSMAFVDSVVGQLRVREACLSAVCGSTVGVVFFGEFSWER